MATRAKSICRHVGCGKLVDTAGYCEPHAKLRHQQADAKRESASARGYNRRWQKARATYLARNPFCMHCLCNAGIEATDLEGVIEACLTKGVTIPKASEVDHIIPHKGDQDLFWDSDNWQGLCKPCHSRKTAREDGGFGHWQR